MYKHRGQARCCSTQKSWHCSTQHLSQASCRTLFPASSTLPARMSAPTASVQETTFRSDTCILPNSLSAPATSLQEAAAEMEVFHAAASRTGIASNTRRASAARPARVGGEESDVRARVGGAGAGEDALGGVEAAAAEVRGEEAPPLGVVVAWARRRRPRWERRSRGVGTRVEAGEWGGDGGRFSLRRRFQADSHPVARLYEFWRMTDG
ncbi:hypothetical protein E2562_020999 [Oryza meyeriana var. granulata]|uniref:Uncharacterized protein n=1 Tax=Oryza meyeriana var. granulata TaxID=110450 RepID=A0A6G1DYQ3_9ORYZ|nr:hypothetical protein E2562_020999 [Oryza meyeriana var. granulata]